MRNMKLTAVVVFLAAFAGTGKAVAGDGHDSTIPAAAGTVESSAAVKEMKTESDSGQKEETIKAALQKYNCLLCHQYKGKGGEVGPALDGHLKHHSTAAFKKLLRKPKKPMPPFPGTAKELDEFVKTVNQKPAAAPGATVKPKAKQVSKTYVCPMGEYEGNKPGKCPKCGMDLVEKK